MITARDLTKEEARTQLKDMCIFEKCGEKVAEIANVSDLENCSLEKKIEILTAVSEIEKQGISEYIIQIFKFIGNYKTSELPYITHAFSKVAETLLGLCESKDKAMLDKVKMLWEFFGNDKIVLGSVSIPVVKKNEEE